GGLTEGIQEYLAVPGRSEVQHVADPNHFERRAHEEEKGARRSYGTDRQGQKRRGYVHAARLCRLARDSFGSLGAPGNPGKAGGSARFAWRDLPRSLCTA